MFGAAPYSHLCSTGVLLPRASAMPSLTRTAPPSGWLNRVRRVPSDRRAVLLARHVEPARADRKDGLPRLQCERSGELNQCIIVHAPVIETGRHDGNAWKLRHTGRMCDIAP